MKNNIGINDKLVRMIIAAIFAVLAFNVNLAFGAVSFVLMGTVIMSWCPIMHVMGKNTCTVSDTRAA